MVIRGNTVVMILCWGKNLTRASVDDMGKMPLHPYEVGSLRGSFREDVRVISSTKPRDFMDVGSFIFVSKKVKTILEKHGAAAELYPVSLICKGNDHHDSFYLHLLEEVDCLDPEKTVRAGPEYAQPELIK